jgi:outer membrane immunogenic protein
MKLSPICATLALVLSVSSALADGMQSGGPALVAPAPYGWTGFYVGANVGGAWGSSDFTTKTVFSPTGYFATTSVPAIATIGAQSNDSSSFIGGGQLGYNWQSGVLLFGIETDFNFLGLKDSRSGTTTYPCCAPTAFTIQSSTKADWLYTLRPRIGIVSGHWMLYATGGLAVTNLRSSFLFTDTFATAHESASFDSTRAGWTIGGGGEMLLSGNWSVKLEYLFVDFGNGSTTSTNLTAFTPSIAFPTNVFTHNADLQAQIVRAGINYKF